MPHSAEAPSHCRIQGSRNTIRKCTVQTDWGCRGMAVACARMAREGFREAAETVLKLKGQGGHQWARLM